LDESSLYNEFHHDEPWNSPHNLTLLERMPQAFQHAISQTKPGYTVFQMPTGDGFVGNLQSHTLFTNITDGVSNTVLATETNDEAAVPWTQPEDFNPRLEPQKFRSSDSEFQVVMCDVSAMSIKKDIDPSVLQAICTISGGEIVDFSEANWQRQSVKDNSKQQR